MRIHNSKVGPSSAIHPHFSSAHSTAQQLTLSHFLTSHASKSSPQKLHQARLLLPLPFRVPCRQASNHGAVPRDRRLHCFTPAALHDSK
ncbi:hypothetical protein COP1_019468 [Malus domestica]